MTSVYPTEEKSSPPPTYEQATHSPHTATMPPAFGAYTISSTAFPPQAAPVGMCPTSMMALPSYSSPAGTNMLITTRPLMYGDLPIQCSCPNCYQIIVTRVEKKEALLSWLICSGILLMGGWLGCCLIPFCIDSLKDIEHYCPHCAALLGARRRI
ncbi:unnamed protein product [Rotaria socialis]|uniref:LITAF domain-containing protein n=1 Tax=Rotaria socialis TaxID=392032 RepID=A0A817PN46_9BILA|nr:unnamed protein product [Rotaria socialis]CAF3343234.1 unnamed protein product [Rotaria socialis]CAF3419760.1 unnamed protein product [Rotaria socialis]CAF3702416.1 unnamed protein product [Rotaria socialis]CAF3795305.1 unnamed protein product [Rotaria socialis]